ncbi:MAG: tyrosine-type recombinase/integrase [Cyanobacteriota/Melainabacteria group bacterium]
MQKKSPHPSFSGKSQKKAKPRSSTGIPPVKRPNREKRSREYLTAQEVKLLVDSAKSVGRHGSRDALLILIAYRHALRVGEVIDLKWDQLDLVQAKLHVNRLKNGDNSVHFLEGDEIRALRRLRRNYPESAFVFCSERQGPLSANAVHKIVARAGKLAGLELSVHPHMLRHGKGYQLANNGADTRSIQAYMGHKNIQHTVVYTKLDPSRFKGFGKDITL